MSGFYEGQFEVDSATHIQPFTREQVGFPPGTCFISVENQNIRYRYGDKTPTASDGHLAYMGTEKVFDNPIDIVNLKIIATSGTAVINFTIKGR